LFDDPRSIEGFAGDLDWTRSRAELKSAVGARVALPIVLAFPAGMLDVVVGASLFSLLNVLVSSSHLVCGSVHIFILSNSWRGSM
jgi:hypothetical protein